MNIKVQGHSLTLDQGHSDSIFFPETARPIEAKFHVDPPWDGERSLFKMVQVTWSTWPPCPYMVKKIFFSVTKRLMTLKVDMQRRILEYCQVCSNDESGLTLTYFVARSNFVPYPCVCEEGKTMDFSETIIVDDIKVGRCSQLNEYMKLMSNKGQGNSLILVQISQIQYFQTSFPH